MLNDDNETNNLKLNNTKNAYHTDQTRNNVDKIPYYFFCTNVKSNCKYNKKKTQQVNNNFSQRIHDLNTFVSQLFRCVRKKNSLEITS